MTNTTKTKLTAAFIALSLCVTWFYFIRELPMDNPNNTITPCVFASYVRGGSMKMQQPMRLGTNRVIFFFSVPTPNYSDYKQLSKVWQSRVAGFWLAGQMLQRKTEPVQVTNRNGVPTPTAIGIEVETFVNVFGLYNAGWLLLTFSALIAFEESPVFIVLAVFAGMMYYLTPLDNVVSLPYDMPSMFFWTLSFLLWQRKNYLWMLAAIVLGTAFKETVAVTAMLFFFTTISWRKRWAFFGAAFVACLLLKLWITHAVMGQARVFTADTQAHLSFNVLKGLFTPHLHHFIWFNAGTFIVALFLPMKALIDKGTKFMLVAFLAGMTAACVLAGCGFEPRQFLDVLPISVLYLNRTIQNWRTGKVGPGM